MDPNLACTNEVTPYGENPTARRPRYRGHSRARDTLAQQTEDTLAHRTRDGWPPVTLDSPTPRGPSFAHEPTRRPSAVRVGRNCDLLTPAGGLTEPTGPDNIHVTKSPGTLLPRTARRIQKGEVPAAPVHDHGPAEHSHPQISTEAVSTQPGDTFKRPNPRGPCPRA